MRRAQGVRRAGAAWSLLALSMLPACAPSERAGSVAERVVLVTLDTLRYDVFAGGERGPSCMPSLTALAERGLVFERHYAASSTTQPTHATMFSGRHPWEHGVVRNGMTLPRADAILAEILREEGFWTGAAVGSFAVSARFGFGRGFERFDEEFDLGRDGAWNGRDLEGGHFYRLASGVTARAQALLDQAPPGKQFLWFHFFDPHAPYGDSGPDPISKKGTPGAYRNMELVWPAYREDVAFLDRELGQLLERLLGDEDYRTHVVLTADHGESLGENYTVGHGTRLSEEELHVPLVVISPDVAAGRRADPCGSADLFPTLLGLAGIEAPAGAGRDLLAGAGGTGGSGPVLGMRRTFVKPEREKLLNGKLRTVDGYQFYRLDEQGLVRGNSGKVSFEGAELDPAQRRDLQDFFRSLERALEALDPSELLDDETQGGLEALGYAR